MSVPTRSQRSAHAAFACVQNRRAGLGEKAFGDYETFAKRFPALLLTCGLAQAVAFALAKKQKDYVEDLAAVLKASGHPDVTSDDALSRQARTQPLGGYLRLSRDALDAAGWLKRYAEALGGEE